MSDTELAPLVVAARNGDPVALDELLRRVQPLVRQRCRRMLPYAEDAEEAAQDALAIVATRLDSYDGRGSFVGWVNVIAANSARATYRSLRRRFVEHVDDAPVERPDPRTTSVIAGSRLDLLDSLEALEATRPAVVEAFLLRDLGGLSYEEIVERTGVNLSTVKARVRQARLFLRDRIGLQAS